MKKIDESYHLMGITLFIKDMDSLLITLVDHLKNGHSPITIFTPNPEQVVLAQENPEFLSNLQQATYLVPDGVGLIWATRILAWKQRFSGQVVQPLTQRITGIDLVHKLLSRAKNEQLSVLVIGGREYQHLPDFINWTPGYSNIQSPQPPEEIALKKLLTDKQPEIVFVAFGAPWQEQWVLSHQALLTSSNVKIVMVVGGAFDVIAGKVPRAPRVWQVMGLEWLFRLVQEPWRWRRQLKLLTFIKLVGKELLSGHD